MSTTPISKDSDERDDSSPSTGRRAFAQATLPQWIAIISLIFGGCCSNVFSLEAIIHDEPNMGVSITFFQFLFVAIEGLPSHFSPSHKTFFLKPRQIPFYRWALIVTLFFITSTLNNAALGYHVSIPVYIIFRSGGTLVTMTMGWLISGKRYTTRQIAAVGLLTSGVILSTWSNAHNQKKADAELFNVGILILFAAQILSSFMGIYLEATYLKHGSNWREGLFYTHFLSIPFFIPLFPRITRDFRTLLNSPPLQLAPFLQDILPFPIVIPRHIFFLLVNVMTQYFCVRGVNRLSAISTALTIAIILNIRKFTSLALSVALFGNKLATGVKIGAVLVAAGAAWYAYESRGRNAKRRSNGGLLMKPWKETEMSVLGPRGSHIQLPAPPVIVTVDSAVGTPMGELPDRKEFAGLHSSNNAVENGKARRRSIGEGLG